MASAATKISFTCPNCAKVLRSSTRPPKGKKVKCPACGEAFLPEVDDEDDEATAIQSKPSIKAKAKAPSRDEDDDDEDVKPRSKKKRADDEDEEDDGPRRKRSRADSDDEEDDDRPTRKNKKKKKSGGMLMMVLGVVLLGGGALLSCGLCGIGAFVWPGFLMGKKTDLEAFVPPDANLVMGGSPKMLKAKAGELEKLILQAGGPMRQGVKREDIEMNSEQMLMFGNTRDFDTKLTVVLVSNAADIEKVKRNPDLGPAQTLGGHANVHKVADAGKQNGLPFDYVAFLPNNVIAMAKGDQQGFIATLDRGKKPAQTNAALELSRSVEKSHFWIALAMDAQMRTDLKKGMAPNGFIALPPSVANAVPAVDGIKGVTVSIDIADNQDIKIVASVPCKNADDAAKIKSAAEDSWGQFKAILQVGMMFQRPGQQQAPKAFINDLTAIEFAAQGSSATAKLKLTKQAIEELAAQKNNFPAPGPFPGPGPGPFPQPQPGPGPGPFPQPGPGPFPQPGVGPDVTAPPGAKLFNTFTQLNLKPGDRRDNTFQFTKGKKITATMVSTTNDPFLDVDLFVLNGNKGEAFPLAADRSVGPNGRVSFIVPATGFYRIRVENVGGAGTANTCDDNIYEQ